MSINKIIKKTLLSEVAGISFEVRKWAQIIETYVKDYIQQEKDKLKSDQAKTTNPKSQDDEVFKSKPKSWSSYESSFSSSTDEIPETIYTGSFFTHFETETSKSVAEAFIYGSELHINADVIGDFPNIFRDIRDKLFKVNLHGDGEFDVSVDGGSLDQKYDDAIKEIMEDHMVSEGDFYTQDYEFAKAIEGNNSNGEEPNPNDYIMYSNKKHGDYSGYGGYGSYDYSKYYTPQPKIDKIEIDGKQFPDAYEDFKVDKWVITPSNRIEYDHWKSGYNDDGEYVVYLNMSLGSVGGTMLVHEVKHSYDDWNRMSKGVPAIRDGWEIKNIYTTDFEKLVLGGGTKFNMLNPIIKNYYLGSKLEAPAYLENEYDGGMFGYRDTAKRLMNFKASSLLTKDGQPAKGLQDMWTDLLIDYNIPLFRKYPNVVDFLKYTEKYFNKRGKDILHRIDKMLYIHNKPIPKPYVPKPYTGTTGSYTSYQTTKPSTNPNKQKMDELDRQIDVMDDKLDALELQWNRLFSADRVGNKKTLDRLDKIIDDITDERNTLVELWNELNKKSNPKGNYNDELPF